MAKTKYTAYVFKDGEREVLSVDLSALPYGKFDKEHPLLIKEDVVVKASKGKELPSFPNVIFQGVFDCSSCEIRKGTVLPEGISELICTHSINNLADLCGVLPASVRKVVVENSILNAIPRDKNGSGALGAAKEFAEMYPNVVVINKKGQILSSVLKDVEEQRKAAAEKTKEKVVVEPVAEESTDDLISKEELIAICTEDTQISAVFSKKEIKELVREALRPKSEVELKERKLIKDAIYVHKDDTEAILQFVREKSTESQTNSVEPVVKAEPVKAKQPATKVEPEKSEKQEQSKEAQKLYLNNKEVQTVKIKKYIPENILGQFALNDQIVILNDIAKINIMPFEISKQQVHYVEEGVIKRAQNLELKNARVLSQKLQGRDNRRIVWYMDGNEFYAVYCFLKHDKSSEYNLRLQAGNEDIEDAIATVKKSIAASKAKGIDVSVDGWISALNVMPVQKKQTKKQPVKKQKACTVPETKTAVVEKQPVEMPVAKPAVVEKQPVETSVVNTEVKAVNQPETEQVTEVDSEKREKYVRTRVVVKSEALDLSNTKVRKYSVQGELLSNALKELDEEKAKCQAAIVSTIKNDIVENVAVNLLQVITEPEPKTEEKVSEDTEMNWNDVYELHASFTVKLQDAIARQSKYLQKISDAKNADEALNYVYKLHGVVSTRKKHEIILGRLETMKKELQKCQQEYQAIQQLAKNRTK
ncbi:MAG: hypothetical protein IKZ34_01000 [Alphaproteobacteria bacterium]|nr:hypothetical protein [Alphaproteobacteria bacterium]